MKTLIIISAIVSALSFFGCNSGTAQPTQPNATGNTSDTKIQVAILLDASNSMDGLIEQAKSRLWNIVNTLTTLKFEGKTPGIQIAIYMYGNDGLSASDNYIKQVTPFTSDLDLISEKLFAITTNGGSEYCGAVIEQAVRKLDWGSEKSNMKLVYIAGNEPFNQGSISYKEAVGEALKKDIYINTIHCGDCSTGIREFWKDGAERGKGKYFCINSNEKIMYVLTPYDDQINTYNDKLNKTYIYYGTKGYSSYSNQSTQDYNAKTISVANCTERVVTKSNKVYNNMSWDLVDKIAADSTYIKNLDKKSLPKEYQDLTTAQIEEEIKQKSSERAKIQKEISLLAKKRQEYINEQSKLSNTEDDLGKAVNSSILEFAKIKGYQID